MTQATPPKSTVEQRLAGADPRIFVFLEAWRRARHDTLLPLRSDFDPMSVPGLLAQMWMYRYDPVRGDFVCKLAGEEVNAAWGGSIKGKTLRQILGPDDHPIVLQRWKFIQRVPLIHYGSAEERLSALETRIAERLILPLASEPDTVDHILGLSLYRISAANRDRPVLVPEDIVQIPCAEV